MALEKRRKKNNGNGMKTKNKWGGAHLESKQIEKYADQWCKDNGYPIQRRKYVYRGKWVEVKRIR